MKYLRMLEKPYNLKHFRLGPAYYKDLLVQCIHRKSHFRCSEAIRISRVIFVRTNLSSMNEFSERPQHAITAHRQIFSSISIDSNAQLILRLMTES